MSTTIVDLRKRWLDAAEAYYDELSGVVLTQLREQEKFTLSVKMTVDGKRVKFSASTSRGAVKGTPHESIIDDHPELPMGEEEQS